MIVGLTISCPDCDEILRNKLVYLEKQPDGVLEIDISMFEQSTWYCYDCDKDWTTSDSVIVGCR